MVLQIAIGTANFGMKYGITSTIGEINNTSVRDILDTARQNYINTIDTALMYDNAHTKLSLYPFLPSFNVISKIPSSNDAHGSTTLIEGVFNTLKLAKIYGLLLHDSRSIFNTDVYNTMNLYKKLGKIEKIGVSVYTPAELLQIINRYTIDLVQIPFNILNQTFVPLLPRLKEMGVEVHIRSIFLQGVLLAPQKFVSQFGDPIQKYIDFLTEHSLSKIEACWNFVHRYSDYIDKVCIGIESSNQLVETLNILPRLSDNNIHFDHLACSNQHIINPALWPK